MDQLLAEHLKTINQSLTNNMLDDEKTLICIKGNPMCGKSTFLKYIFDNLEWGVKLFQTGCNPIYQKVILKHIRYELTNILSDLERNEKIGLFLDEIIDHDLLLDLIRTLKDVKSKIFVSSNIPLIESYQELLEQERA